MKLNNKGFAISTVMYMILIMAVVLITLTLSILSVRKLILDKIRVEASNNIYNVYSISYRTALEILKSEAIEYATTNNVEKDSIMIGDLNSSIDKEILDGYKLSEKYLTMVNNNGSYDVYLGKSKTITNLNESINNLIDIIDYKIEGKSYQETRSGKNLFGIENKTKADVNWQAAENASSRSFEFDKFYVGITSNNYYKEANVASYRIDGDSIFVSSTSNGYGLGIPIKIESNTTYTISGGSSNGILGIAQYDENGNYINDNSLCEISVAEKTFTTLENTKIIIVVLRPLKSAGEVEYKNIQLEKGGTVTAYEKYGAIPSPEFSSKIQSVGDLVTDSSDPNYGKYEIPIKVIGKNLMVSVTNLKHTAYGVTIKSSLNQSTFSINGESNTDGGHLVAINGPKFSVGEYKIKIEGNDNLKHYFIQGLRDDGTWIKNYEVGLKLNQTYKFTIDEDANIRIGIVLLNGINHDDEYKVIIQKTDDNEIEYEPYVSKNTSIYLNEPLRCIEDKCDYIDFENQKVVRKIKGMSFTGEENWSKYVSVDKHYQITVGDNLFNKSEYCVLSNYYISYKIKNNYYSSMDYAVMSVDGSRIRFKNKDISDLDGWIDFVSSKYESGVPLTIIYALRESKEESIELPRIDINSLSTNIYVDTTIQPNSVELTAIQKIKQI